MTTTARWSTHPARYAAATAGPIPPDTRTDAPRPVAITAVCDLVRTTSTSTDAQSFSVREYLNLDNGNRVCLREGLEFTFAEPCVNMREALCAETLIAAIRGVVLPEVSAADPDRPWDCLVKLARRRRVHTTPEELAELPYEVTLSDAVRAWL